MMRFWSTLFLLFLALALGTAQQNTSSSSKFVYPSYHLSPIAELLHIVQNTVTNVTNLVNSVLASNRETTEAFIDLVRDLTSSNGNCTVNNHQLQELQNNFSCPLAPGGTRQLQPLPRSCKDIASKWPNASSGFYTIVNAHGSNVNVYCHMDQLCGVADSWTRVAFLNMTDPSENCPSGFKLYKHGHVRACGKYNSGCLSTSFPTHNIPYTKVCGRVRGYQFGSPDGTWAGGTLDNPHFDGISLTCGSPRKNLWAFIGAWQKGRQVCPCAKPSARPVLSYIGNHYYCDSGNNHPWQPAFYTEPLWDGKGCLAADSACCQRPLIPWFYRSLSIPVTDTIELRDCGDEAVSNEDTPVDQYEIYIA